MPVNYPIPSNMETPVNNPYRTPFSWRTTMSDLFRGAVLPPGTDLVDNMMGNPLQGMTDRMFGAQNDRLTSDYNSYMRDLMRSDEGNRRGGFAQRLRDMFSRGSSRAPSGPSGIPGWMRPGAPMSAQNPYSPNWPGAGTWPSGGQSEASNPYYGQGQGMMRMPGANQPGYAGNRGGTRGTTIATGPAAQAMYEGMRDSARAQLMDQIQREARERADSILK